MSDRSVMFDWVANYYNNHSRTTMNILKKLLPALAAVAVSTSAFADNQLSASMLSGEIAFGGSQAAAPWTVSFGPKTMAFDVSRPMFNKRATSSVTSLPYVSVTSTADHGVVLSAFGTAIAQRRVEGSNQALLPSVIWADGAGASGSWWASNWWIPVVGVAGVAAAASGSSSGNSSSDLDDGKDGSCNVPNNDPTQPVDPDCESNVEMN